MALRQSQPTTTAADLGRSVLTLCRSWERKGSWYPSTALAVWCEIATLGTRDHPAVWLAVWEARIPHGWVCHHFTLQSVDGLWPNNPLMSNGAMTKNMVQMSWHMSWSDSTPELLPQTKNLQGESRNSWLIKCVTTVKVDEWWEKSSNWTHVVSKHWGRQLLSLLHLLSTMPWTLVMGKALLFLNVFQTNACWEQIYFCCF